MHVALRSGSIVLVALPALLAGGASLMPRAEVPEATACLYRSEDGGATWEALSLGMLGVSALAIDPARPATLYAGTEGSGVYKSLDAGATWTPASAGLASLSINALGINHERPPVLHAATTGGLYQSIDGAASWNAVGPKLPNPVFRSVVSDPVDAAVHYAADALWVAKSTDGGDTWTWSTVGGDYVTSLAVDPRAPATLYAGVYRGTPRGGGVYKSVDGGGSWEFASHAVAGPTGRCHDVYAIAVAPSGDPVVYAGTGGGVYRSRDGAATWQPASAGLGDLSVRALAIDPRRPTTLYAAADGEGIFKTTDGGTSWTAITRGLDLRLPIALAIDPADPARLYVGLRGAGPDASAARIAVLR